MRVPSYSLSHVAFGGGVEGGHLHCAGVLWTHLKQHLLKRVKFTALCIHIILVDLKWENSLNTEGLINKTVLFMKKKFCTCNELK